MKNEYFPIRITLIFLFIIFCASFIGLVTLPQKLLEIFLILSCVMMWILVNSIEKKNIMIAILEDQWSYLKNELKEARKNEIQ